MTAAHRPPRCAEAADGRGDPRAGSASPVSRWFLLEQPGPWGRDALMSSRLDVVVAAEVSRRAMAAGARVLLVRRHGRAGHTGHTGRRHWALVDSRPGTEAIRWGRFEHDEELLDVPLDGRAVARAHEGPAGGARPVYLACAHGRHDTCCAVRGRQVAAALDALAPGRVWECSHLGGCRFAANVVVLPHGLHYGGVTPASAAGLVEATERGHVVPELLRGRSSLPAAVQAAQHHARAALTIDTPRADTPHIDVTRIDVTRVDTLRIDTTTIDTFSTIGTRTMDDGSVAVELAAAGRVLHVTVARVATAAPGLLTCAATRPASPMGWELVSLTEPDDPV